MLLIKASVRPSAIHGMGCFAEEPIRKGQVFWQLDPRMDPIIPYEELETFPAAAQAFLNMYGYVRMWDDRKVIILCGDHSKHMNHSATPNCIDITVDGVDANVAARDIAIGEELTCDYAAFDLASKEKLGF